MNLRIDNEIEALSSIYLDKIQIIQKNPTKTIELTLISNILNLHKDQRPNCWIKIRVEYTMDYPSKGPTITISETYNLKDTEVDSIKMRISSIIQNRTKQNFEMVHEICQYIQTYLNDIGILNQPLNISSHSKNSKDSINNQEMKEFLPENYSNIKNPFEDVRDIRKVSISSKDEQRPSPSGTVSANSDDVKEEDKLGLVIEGKKPEMFTSRFKTDFEIINKLGEGGGGSVYKVKNKWDGMVYAIKIIQVTIFNPMNEKKILSKLRNEGSVLSRLQYKHIVRYYQMWVEDCDEYTRKMLRTMENNYSIGFDSDDSEDSDSLGVAMKKVLYIQMEYCEGKTLKELIESKSLKEEDKWKLITELLNAIQYIHNNNLIHRDIKPGNIFLGKKNEVKIGDFGLARVSKKVAAGDVQMGIMRQTNKEFLQVNNDVMTYNIGTKYYCSPEQEKQKKYDSKTDMFSLGIIIFEMFYDFKSLIERDKVLREIKEKHVFPEDFVKSVNAKVYKIVSRLTENDPKNRPSAYELLQSNLVPVIVDRDAVISSFKKIIFDNPDYTERFIDILIDYSCLKSRSKDTTFFDSSLLSEAANSSLKERVEHYNQIVYLIKRNFKPNTFKFQNKQLALYDPEITLYDSILNQNIPVIIKREGVNKEGLLLRKNGSVFTVNTVRSFFSEVRALLYTAYTANDFVPLSFYTEINNEVIYTQVWNDNSLFDCDEKYIIESLQILFSILNNLEIEKERITIQINSSKILDLICGKLNLETNPENKVNTLLYKKDAISTLMSINGDLESIKTKYIKKEFTSEINYITSLFNKKNYFWSKDLFNYRDNIRIDSSLISKDLLFYSGLIIRVVCENQKGEEFVIAEGGNCHNLVNKPKEEMIFKAFALRFFADQIIKIQPKKVDNEMNCSVLLLRRSGVKDKDLMRIQKKIDEFSVKKETIFKPVNDEVNFMDLNKYYRMKVALVLSLQEKKDKESESEEEEKEKEEDEKKNKKEEKEKKKKNKEKKEEKDKDKKNENLTIDFISKDGIKTFKEGIDKWEDFLLALETLLFKKRRPKI